MRTAAAMVWVLIAACSRRDYCNELNSQAPNGVVLSTEDARCEQLLNFAHDAEERYQMPFKDWLVTVAGQRVEMVTQTMLALTRSGWRPMSFQAEPHEVPCAPGLATSSETWTASPLASILPTRPDHLYVSLSLDIVGDVATIHAYQDFDCDKTVAVDELVGRFKQGFDPLGGGWMLVSSSIPEIDE